MKKLLPVGVVFLTIILNTIRVVASDKLNIVNEFVITGDSAKFYFSPVATVNEDKLYLFFSEDNKNRTLCYNMKGEKIGQNKFTFFTSNIRRIDFYDNYLSVKLFYGRNDTIYYYNFVYSKDFTTFDKIIETTYFNGYIDSYTTQIPRKDSSLYFLMFSLNKNNMSIHEYHIIITDLNYQIIKIIELDNTNIDADQYKGGGPIYCLDNGHFTFRLLKSKGGNPFKTDEYMYEYDFSGKFYSKKLIDNKIVFDNDTLDYKPILNSKPKDYSQIIFSKLTNVNKALYCIIKFASNGEIKWIKQIDDYNNNFGATSIEYLENQQIIALYGRFYPDGNNKNPYGSYLELFDKDGNHLETYTWQRNKYLDCTVFNVLEGPGNHLLVITKNGSDSLVVSEIIPKYLSAKENSVLSKNIYLSPNPTTSTAYVNLQQEGQVAITAVDLLGRSFPLWSGYASTGDMELDVSTLPIGSYTLLIDYGTKREAVRMMKE